MPKDTRKTVASGSGGGGGQGEKQGGKKSTRPHSHKTVSKESKETFHKLAKVRHAAFVAADQVDAKGKPVRKGAGALWEDWSFPKGKHIKKAYNEEIATGRTNDGVEYVWRTAQAVATKEYLVKKSKKTLDEVKAAALKTTFEDSEDEDEDDE
ncbi:hypothetical protein JCM9279_002268 [Rhodotorula babjevae]